MLARAEIRRPLIRARFAKRIPPLCFGKGKIMTEQMYTIKEAAKQLNVEAHALRYWEEELDLSIERNAQGRRIYTEENMRLFRKIMAWKEEGFSLKSIRQLIHGDSHDVKESMLYEKPAETGLSSNRDEMGRNRIIMYRPKEVDRLEPVENRSSELEATEKTRRLQELLKHFISDSIRECNAELLQVMKEGLLKELDYQFRLQEEREAEREKVRIEIEDAHFKKLDENLRSAMEKGRKKKKSVFRN